MTLEWRLSLSPCRYRGHPAVVEGLGRRPWAGVVWWEEGAVGLEWGDGGKGGAQLVGTWAFTLSKMGSFWKVLMKSTGTRSLLLYGEQIRREVKGPLLGGCCSPAGERLGPGGGGSGRQSPLKPPPRGITKLLLVGRRVGQSGFGGGRSWESGGTY